ncbi:MAG: hypothetical protein JXX29_23895, partial [Deltaproteobacteria bacterium]|nr:hypothetical protein [Deltaproteobacteria bacterium]MBN2674745.1 hypothetical protein [Deltaproteobacteria bacterium]
MKYYWIIFGGLLMLVLSCGEVDEGTTGVDGDADGDSDGDSDSDADGDADSVCVDGKKSCDGNMVVICSGGQWIDWDNCDVAGRT